MKVKTNKLRIRSKIWIEDETGKVIFGQGRLKILEAVIRHGSIHSAAKELKRAPYTKPSVLEERFQAMVEAGLLTDEGDGVRIFIGSENKLFSLSGSSLVVSPYMNADRKIVGAVGVIGPTRLNYGRIVPIVDYTAQLVGKLISDRGKG